MNVTIKEIARIAGISRGTVDRVIHDRPGVKPEVRDRVLKIIKQFDYRPNLAGKALVQTNKNLKIGVVLSPDFNPFVEEMKKGISDEASKISSFGVEIDVEVIRAFDAAEQLSVLDGLCSKGVSAIAIVPVDSPEITRRINEISGRGVPVVTFNSDLETSKRICFVGQHNYRAGRTQGELASLFLRNNKYPKIAIITSTFHLACHKERVRGFTDLMGERESVSIVEIKENFDRDEEAYTLANRFLTNYQDLDLLYLTGGGIAGVAKAIRRHRKAGELFVLCHDLLSETKELLAEHVVDVVIGQDPYSQGSLPIRILYEYLFIRKIPEKRCIYTDIEIFTKENCNA